MIETKAQKAFRPDVELHDFASLLFSSLEGARIANNLTRDKGSPTKTLVSLSNT